MPVSLPSSFSTGRTVMLESRVRRAMSSASSSMETPALTCLTFDWLSTSRSKGMSREALSVMVFFADFERDIFLLRDGRPGATLPTSSTRHEIPVPPFPLRRRPRHFLAAGDCCALTLLRPHPAVRHQDRRHDRIPQPRLHRDRDGQAGSLTPSMQGKPHG